MRRTLTLLLASTLASADPVDDLQERVGAAEEPAKIAAALTEGLRGDWAKELDADAVSRLRDVEMETLGRIARIEVAGPHSWSASERGLVEEVIEDRPLLLPWDKVTGAQSGEGRKVEKLQRGLRAATCAAFLLRRDTGTVTVDLAPVALRWTDAALTASCGDAAGQAASPAAGEWHAFAVRWEGKKVSVEVDGAAVLELEAGAGRIRAVGFAADGDCRLAAAAAVDGSPGAFPAGEWHGEYHYGTDPASGTDFVARLNEANGRITGTVTDGKRDPGTVDCISDVEGSWNSVTGEFRFEKTYRNDGHTIQYHGRLQAKTGRMDGYWSYSTGGSRDGSFDMRQVRSSD
ncbi:MAG: hypothetical protein HYY18_18805 [Planctomycetes bacterium]|nr:hypothetical protein [Planctomycetota bacterium]